MHEQIIELTTAQYVTVGMERAGVHYRRRGLNSRRQAQESRRGVLHDRRTDRADRRQEVTDHHRTVIDRRCRGGLRGRREVIGDRRHCCDRRQGVRDRRAA